MSKKYVVHMIGGRLYRDHNWEVVFGFWKSLYLVCAPWSRAYGGAMTPYRPGNTVPPDEKRLHKEKP